MLLLEEKYKSINTYERELGGKVGKNKLNNEII